MNPDNANYLRHATQSHLPILNFTSKHGARETHLQEKIRLFKILLGSFCDDRNIHVHASIGIRHCYRSG